MTYKNIIYTSLFLLIAFASFGQTMTITSPSIAPPYQVATGTAVTFEWDAFSSPPAAIYTYSQVPTVNQYMAPNSAWTAHSNFTPNPSGTYSITININADTWVFGGLNSFLGWSYSNVLAIQTISAYVITADDSLICTSNDSVMFSAPGGAGLTYQWYMGYTRISGATDSIYYATVAGSYHCDITDGTTVNTTNTIAISNYTVSYSGVLGANQMVLTADQTFSSYQWYERTSTGSLTQIVGATSSSYTAPITNTLKYYVLEAISAGGCNIQSQERPVVDTLFTTPIAILYAQQNSFGAICSGTPVSIAVNNNPGTITWYKNSVMANTTDSLNIWGAYQNGTWYAEATCLYWPEVSINSNSVVVNITDLISPAVSGANYYDFFCPGVTIPMV